MTPRPPAEPEIDLWNVRDGVPVYTGAQSVVNFLGRLRRPEEVGDLTYSLNGGPARPVFFKNSEAKANRLALPGDFNIDTIGRDQIQSDNTLVMTASLRNGDSVEQTWRFPSRPAGDHDKSFRLDLRGVEHSQQVSQMVDGRWRVGGEGEGKRWLEIAEEDAGLDRVILFGRDDLTTGYTIRARVLVTSWVGMPHNVGLLFKWNPHLRGDGTILPSQWSTALGYYYSNCPGIRIRYGVDVHVNADGQKIGDYVLAEAKLSRWRDLTGRLIKRFAGKERIFAQLAPGTPYCFELRIEEAVHTLTVWKCGRSKPSPQVVVENPTQYLKSGAAGIIAHRCGVRVYDFEVEHD
jgi:hypothetical protein